jgi:hypothetical protein
MPDLEETPGPANGYGLSQKLKCYLVGGIRLREHGCRRLLKDLVS